MKYTLVTLALLGEASAWWDKGHLIVNKIAYDSLAKENPSVLAKVESLLDVYAKVNPALTKQEKNHRFVECASWADVIKGKGGKFQG